MKRFCIFLFILLPSFNCLYANKLDILKQNTEAIEVHSLNTFMGDTYYRVYHSGPFVLYQSQYFFSSSVQQLRFNQDETELHAEADSIVDEVRFKYTVFHKDSVFGYEFYADEPMKN